MLRRQVIKLLHIISSNDIGGAERMLQKILDHKGSESHDSYILCLNEPGALTPIYEKQVKKIWFLPKKQTFSRKLFKIIKELRVLSPDVTMGWMYRGMLMSWFVKKMIGRTRLIWTVRKSLNNIKDETFKTRILIKVLSYISKSPDVTLYNSKDAISKHVENGFCSSNTDFVPNGFDENKFCPKGKDSLFLNELNIKTSSPLICVVARYHPCKGHSVVIEAAAKLKDKKINCQFLFVGNEFEQMPKVLNDQIKQHGLGEMFFSRGAVLDASVVYSSSDAVVSSSYVEGFSNSIGEALFCNKPVFVSDAGDSEYIVGDGKFVFKKGDAESLSMMISNWLLLKSDEKESFQEEQFDRAKRLFSIEKVGAAYYSIITGE